MDSTIGEIDRLLVMKGYAVTFSKQENGKVMKSGAPQTDLLMTLWCLEQA
jgi:hypothetical protein